MNASNGIAFVLLAFPLYLLWRGRLPAYLALTTTAATPSTPTGTAIAPNQTTLGNGAPVTPSNVPGAATLNNVITGLSGLQ